MTDTEIFNWALSEDSTEDDFHQHFETFGRWNWCDVAEESRRIRSVIAVEPLHTNYAIDAVLSATAAQASFGAYAAMAAALGVDSDDLRITVAQWSERQNNPPPPVTAERLMEMVKETRQEDSDRNATRQA